MKKKILLLLITISTLFVSCFEDLDDNIQTASDLDIENFIYRELNYFYLYKADTPELANYNFANQGELNTFLNSFETPESLFSFLKSPQDRFSLLVANYNELEDATLTTTILTTEANEFFAKIHNKKKRMPLILDELYFEDWLDTGITNQEINEIMLTGLNKKQFKAHPVSRNLYKKGVDTNKPCIIEPVQKDTLF